MKHGERLLGVVMAVVIAAACGSSEPQGDTSARRCTETNVREPCACTDGRRGEQVCGLDGALRGCDCGAVPVPGANGGTKPAMVGNGGEGDGDEGGSENTSPPRGGTAGSGAEGGGEAEPAETAGAGGGTADNGGGPCDVGDLQGCRCADYALGRRECERGSFGECTCEVFGSEVPATGCVPQPEICNGLDDDCNGLIDEHFICRDDTVRHAQPFDRAVYIHGRTSSTCGSDVLQRVWPTIEATYIGGLGCYTNIFLFAEFDDGLYYSTSARIYRKHAGPGATELPTPACGASTNHGFGFDAAGVITYACGGILRRGQAEILTGSIGTIVAVLADGRVIVTREGPRGMQQYVVLDTEGTELVRFPPLGMFSGRTDLEPRATTTIGNTAYVAVARTYVETTSELSELVVYQIDEESIFRLMRRLIVPRLGPWQLVASDATVFYRRNGGDFITAYHPDNTSTVVWRPADSPDVDATNGGLVAAPLNPKLREQSAD